ncbi:aldo/keto reductase [Rhodococcus sp. ARC_M12]|uniref:aldo/keto reductase n=1 Tax=unclassified Rhodococcus (in: high G+C Gram-positive bacteria) TaxID=192944 RepID=UPI001FB1FAA7|nr:MULTISPECIES: aldo/keto reductase [unclassified Rhodococcus (in: high G+C Gram-positive bacteria)]MCJ0893123.1 aldo/keto reductase [Rhodococcus sp. ARC_M5]MCJ0977332.1 aldo/keto reductase [Rhodococcus sp. ARC_M12]
MRYTTFGRRSGLRVSEFALGTGNFGTSWSSGTDAAEARIIFDRFAQAGGTFLDTANMYQAGESEVILGDLVAADRDHFVVSTKYGASDTTEPHVSSTGSGRKNMISSVEASLRRLRTDYLDLLWVHFPDGVTPIDEIVRGMDDLVRSGKIHHVALSNYPAWQVSAAATLADMRGWAPIVGIQTEYSLVERTADRELMPMAESLGLAVNLWSPLSGGLLTGKYRTGAEGRATDPDRFVTPEHSAQRTAVIDEVLAIAQQTGASAAQVSMAWLRERGDRSAATLIPIVGPRTVAQLNEYLGALDVTLTDEQYTRLDAVSAVELGVPHWINAQIRPNLLGGDASRFMGPLTPIA